VYLEDTLYLAQFLIGKFAFQIFSPSGGVGILPYVLSIIGKEMKINLLFASAVHQNALRGRSYPKEHTLAKARAGLFQAECLNWMALPHFNL
jgi:hypothetical protein